MKLLLSLLTLFYTLVSISYASYGNILDSKYNSISTSLTTSQGDVEGTSFGLSGSLEVADNLVYTYNYSDSDYDEVLGNDFSNFGFEVEGTAFDFGMGYIFRNNDIHVIPFISLGKSDYTVESLDLFEVDTHSVGVTVRKQVSDNSIFNFSIENINVDQHSISDTNEAILLAAATANSIDLTAIDIDDPEELADAALGDRTVVSIGLEIFYNEDLSVTYTATSTDFDTTTVSAEATYNF